VARALAAALAAALLAVPGAAGMPDAQSPRRGGTIDVGTMREPPCINAYLLKCTENDPPNLMRLVLRGAFRVGPERTWQPDLVTRADFTTRPPLTITYRIRPEARWSDGVPVTAHDFVFTHETRKAVADGLINFQKEHLNVIRSVRAVDAKTVEVVLNQRFAQWRGFFQHVLPRHALLGEDFSTVWVDRIHNPKTGEPIGSGPFLLERWERGRAVTFVRNPRYWGPHLAYLGRLVVHFCRACADLGSEQTELLRRGELDLATFAPVSGQEVQELRRLPGIRVLAAPGLIWEHLEIRIGSGGHPALGRKLVRRALAYGIDRVAIARALYGAIDARYPQSDSAVFPTSSAHYRPNWSTYRYRPAEAAVPVPTASTTAPASGCHFAS
jgi:peptide/nickel transport system substrate-binding protein